MKTITKDYSNSGITCEEIWRKNTTNFKLTVHTESHTPQSFIRLYVWTSAGFSLVSQLDPKQQFDLCPTNIEKDWKEKIELLFNKSKMFFKKELIDWF
jgi:hypothetical protein